MAQGARDLERDVGRVAEWFTARGLPTEAGNAGSLLAALQAELRTGGRFS